VNAPDNLTRTAEWIKAEKEYLEKQVSLGKQQ
jgi:hypothetical protein